MKRSPVFTKLAVLSLIAALPFAAAAQDAHSGLSYNYVQGGYSATNTDAGDADGWNVAGSVAVHPNVHLFGSFTNQTVDGTSADYDQWQVGAGYNKAFSSRSDFVARVAYEKYDAGHGFDFDGYSAEAGVRSALLPQLEGYAMLGYEDADAVDGEAYARLGAQYKFNQNWGLAANVKVVDGGDTQWFVGPRLTW